MRNREKRDGEARAFLEALYQKAIDRDIRPNELPYGKAMDELFQTTAWGFREILLVVVVGMKLDPTYRASAQLYRCNPRAIYEGPIKEFLLEKAIPHRKSGPLNVAKATPGLDKTWAAQRRPSDVAQAVVEIITFLEMAHDRAGAIKDVGVSLLRRLISQAGELSALAVEISPDENPWRLYTLCSELIRSTPDAGNTPQKIAALLLECFHASFHTGVDVTGGDDRASVTSTTSKKPGDINEERGGEIYKVYEVTVKPFDLARITDSFDCISAYRTQTGAEIHEITVLCRPEDCPADMTASGLHTYLGQYGYRDVVYSFWDLFEWIALLLQRMTPEGRGMFYSLLNDYVNEMNTAEAVKRLWNELHRE